MSNQKTVQIVVGVLGLVAILVVLGGIVLALDDKQLPESLIAIGSLSVGAVAGILSKTGDTDVRVVNDPAEPVPVEGGI